jgi:hypothetical protein
MVQMLVEAKDIMSLCVHSALSKWKCGADRCCPLFPVSVRQFLYICFTTLTVVVGMRGPWYFLIANDGLWKVRNQGTSFMRMLLRKTMENGRSSAGNPCCCRTN